MRLNGSDLIIPQAPDVKDLPARSSSSSDEYCPDWQLTVTMWWILSVSPSTAAVLVLMKEAIGLAVLFYSLSIDPFIWDGLLHIGPYITIYYLFSSWKTTL